MSPFTAITAWHENSIGFVAKDNSPYHDEDHSGFIPCTKKGFKHTLINNEYCYFSHANEILGTTTRLLLYFSTGIGVDIMCSCPLWGECRNVLPLYDSYMLVQTAGMLKVLYIQYLLPVLRYSTCRSANERCDNGWERCRGRWCTYVYLVLNVLCTSHTVYGEVATQDKCLICI